MTLQNNTRLPENSYICIQAFMIDDLKLRGVEKEIYALIYGFSQDGKSEFSGSLSYIQKWTTSSKPTVLKAINSLLTKGLIQKTQTTRNPTSCNHYRVNLNMLKSLLFRASNNGKSETTTNCQTETVTTSKETLHDVTPGQNLLKNFTSKEYDQTSKDLLQATSQKTWPYNIENKINNTPNPNPKNLINNKTTSQDSDKDCKNSNEDNEPTYEDVIAFSKILGERLSIDPDWFFTYNDKRGWHDKQGNKIKSWKALFNKWNSSQYKKLQAETQRRAERKTKTKERIQLQKKQQVEQNKARARELEAKTQMSCPKCGRTLPNKNIKFNVLNSVFTCLKCNQTWAFIKEDKPKTKQKVVV